MKGLRKSKPISDLAGGSLLDWLEEDNLKLDQRLTRCLELVGTSSLDDEHVLEGLIELNATSLARFNFSLPDPSAGSHFWLLP